MIRREDGNDWLLVPQIEHARLAAEIAACWAIDQKGTQPCSEQLVSAVRHHDDGWCEWDEAPHIDPASGIPRSFTEMRMRDATDIWTRSIDICSRDVTWYASTVGKHRPHRSDEVEAVVREVLAMAPRFSAEELAERLQPGERGPRKRHDTMFHAMLALQGLEELGWIVKLSGDSVDARYERHIPSEPPSPLGGIAVSKHFCWLAEQARESRADDEDETKCLDEFLTAQLERQRSWRTAIPVSSFSSEELDEHVESAFHSVQFFDRLSLWLCCARRTEPLRITCPNLGPIVFQPRSDGAITVKPFPFPVERLLHANQPMRFEVGAKRASARRYANDAELQSAMRAAESEQVTWTFSLW